MAPLATTVAATLAATVVVGVGVALARAERNRRLAVGGTRERRFSLLGDEELSDGLRRMALGQLDLAIELLCGDAAGDPPATAVHDTRKALKRLRALMRLLEQELGRSAFAREDRILRRAGLRLAGARDAEVLVATLDGLLERDPRKLGRRAGVRRLREQLVAERDLARDRTMRDRATRAQVLEDLRALRGRVTDWRLSDRDGVQVVAPGLERLYRQGRRRYRRAARGKGDVGRAMHRWRKRVKDLRYAAEALDRRAGPGAGGQRARRALEAEPIRRLARGADELGELLGEEHDLGVLAERLRRAGKRGGSKGVHVGGGTRAILLKAIARRRKRLRRRAVRKGERIYRQRPKKFVRRVEKLHRRAAGPTISPTLSTVRAWRMKEPHTRAAQPGRAVSRR